MITAEHVEVIRDTPWTACPGFVDTATREQIEVDLVRVARPGSDPRNSPTPPT